MAVVASVVVAVIVGYTLVLFGLSRRRRGLPNPASPSLFFVFMVPCYNEELVVGQTLERLLASRVAGYAGFAILVVDDGSDDATASIVASFDDPRVWLLSRRLPDARKGKGEALNAAYRYLRDSDLLVGRDLSSVVVCVMDADGRLEPNALYEVGPYFADPRAGAVQVGVRMYNAGENRLTRLQDIEFVTFTEIFQRGRQLVGSVGLGGNGQFARLTALLALGDAPWTDYLTEDLDLGIRFLIGGWRNNFCPTTHVNQQAVNGIRRLLRQRIRWFQGHLQCWARLPDIFRSDLPTAATMDLVQHLLSPALLLLLSIPMLAFYLAVLFGLVLAPHRLQIALFSAHGLPLLALYLLTFGLAPVYAYTYWLRTRDIRFLRALGWAHVYIFYTYLWIPAGWCALGRLVFRQRDWAKTTRTTKPREPGAPPAPLVGSPGS